MRHLALILLLALACKSDSGDEAGESNSSTGCSDDVIGDADPNYPPCSCDFKCEDADAMCRFTDMSSICEPECVDHSDCPALAGISATCNGGHCFVPCDEEQPCPTGYVCLENIQCQAAR